jgi:hypothetical protein
MAAEFHQLLDSTIAHLESLRADGVQFVPLEADTLHALNGSVAAAPKPATVGAPASGPARSLQPSALVAPVIQSPPAPAPARAITELRAASPEKIQAITELRERALQCMKCANLAATRTNVVFGVGNIDAELMFVGEAPGADEDAAGEPFVGAAGQLLTKMIAAMGLTR